MLLPKKRIQLMLAAIPFIVAVSLFEITIAQESEALLKTSLTASSSQGRPKIEPKSDKKHARVSLESKPFDLDERPELLDESLSSSLFAARHGWLLTEPNSSSNATNRTTIRDESDQNQQGISGENKSAKSAGRERSSRRLSNIWSMFLPGVSSDDDDDGAPDGSEMGPPSTEIYTDGSNTTATFLVTPSSNTSSSLALVEPQTGNKSETITISSAELYQSGRQSYKSSEKNKDLHDEKLVAKYSRPPRQESNKNSPASSFLPSPLTNQNSSSSSSESPGRSEQLITGNLSGELSSSSANMNEIMSSLIGSVSLPAGASTERPPMLASGSLSSSGAVGEREGDEDAPFGVGYNSSSVAADQFERWLNRINFVEANGTLAKKNESASRASDPAAQVARHDMLRTGHHQWRLNHHQPTRQPALNPITTSTTSNQVPSGEMVRMVEALAASMRSRQNGSQTGKARVGTKSPIGIYQHYQPVKLATKSTLERAVPPGAQMARLREPELAHLVASMRQPQSLAQTSNPSAVGQSSLVQMSANSSGLTEQSELQSQDEILRQVTSAINFEQQLNHKQADTSTSRADQNNDIQAIEPASFAKLPKSGSSPSDQTLEWAKDRQSQASQNELASMDISSQAMNRSAMDQLKAGIGANIQLGSGLELDKNLDQLADRLRSMAQSQQNGSLSNQPSWLRRPIAFGADLFSAGNTSSIVNLNDSLANQRAETASIEQLRELLQKHEKSKNELKSSEERMNELLRQLLESPGRQSAGTNHLRPVQLSHSSDPPGQQIPQSAANMGWTPISSLHHQPSTIPMSPVQMAKLKRIREPIRISQMRDNVGVGKDELNGDSYTDELALMFASSKGQLKGGHQVQQENLLGLPIAILKEAQEEEEESELAGANELGSAQLEATAEHLFERNRELARQKQLQGQYSGLTSLKQQPNNKRSEIEAALAKLEPAGATRAMLGQLSRSPSSIGEQYQPKLVLPGHRQLSHGASHSRPAPGTAEADSEAEAEMQQAYPNQHAHLHPNAEVAPVDAQREAPGGQQHLLTASTGVAGSEVSGQGAPGPPPQPRAPQASSGPARDLQGPSGSKPAKQVQISGPHRAPDSLKAHPVTRNQQQQQQPAPGVPGEADMGEQRRQPPAPVTMLMLRGSQQLGPPLLAASLAPASPKGPPVRFREISVYRPFGYESHHALAYQASPALSALFPGLSQAGRPSILRHMTPFRAIQTQRGLLHPASLLPAGPQVSQQPAESSLARSKLERYQQQLFQPARNSYRRQQHLHVTSEPMQLLDAIPPIRPSRHYAATMRPTPDALMSPPKRRSPADGLTWPILPANQFIEQRKQLSHQPHHHPLKLQQLHRLHQLHQQQQQQRQQHGHYQQHQQVNHQPAEARLELEQHEQMDHELDDIKLVPDEPEPKQAHLAMEPIIQTHLITRRDKVHQSRPAGLHLYPKQMMQPMRPNMYDTIKRSRMDQPAVKSCKPYNTAAAAAPPPPLVTAATATATTTTTSFSTASTNNSANLEAATITDQQNLKQNNGNKSNPTATAAAVAAAVAPTTNTTSTTTSSTISSSTIKTSSL